MNSFLHTRVFSVIRRLQQKSSTQCAALVNFSKNTNCLFNAKLHSKSCYHPCKDHLMWCTLGWKARCYSISRLWNKESCRPLCSWEIGERTYLGIDHAAEVKRDERKWLNSFYSWVSGSLPFSTMKLRQIWNILLTYQWTVFILKNASVPFFSRKWLKTAC